MAFPLEDRRSASLSRGIVSSGSHVARIHGIALEVELDTRPLSIAKNGVIPIPAATHNSFLSCSSCCVTLGDVVGYVSLVNIILEDVQRMFVLNSNSKDTRTQ